MKRTGSRLVMGSAIGLAAIAVAIDHTRHEVPEPEPAAAIPQQYMVEPGQVPCGLDAAPCGLSASPCGLDASPCGLGTSPCALQPESNSDVSPCSL